MERLIQKDKKGFYLLLPCGEKEYFTDNREFMNAYWLKKVINKLGELEDVLEKYNIENLDDFIKEYSSRNIKLANDNYALEQELAELKQKAIVPKFVVGQEIWDKYLMAWKIKRVETHQFDKGNGNTAIIEIYRLGHDGNDDYSCCILPIDNDIIFATKDEAEQKLAEIGGKDE